MKRLYLYVVAILAVIGAIYLWGHRSQYGLLRDWLPSKSPQGLILAGQGQHLNWRSVDESLMGFKLEMPGEPRQVVVQANTETDTTEPIQMLIVKLDADRTYAIAWADKPPVARMNDLVPDRTLDQARDGALMRTGTTLVTESRNSPQGFPGRDVVSHNVGGGILDARYIYAGPRLYMLIAASSSAATRDQEEVIRFFNSFTVAGNTQIPETIPAKIE